MKKIAILFLVVSLVSCKKENNLSRPPQDLGCDTLILLSTNDVHAHIGNMPKEAAYVQDLRKRYSTVLLLSAGDIFSGDPVVDQYEENGTPKRGFPIIDLMNRLDYLAMALGNHDFDYGKDVLKDRIAQAGFPVLCANADFSGTVLAGMVPEYYTIDTAGVKITFLAFVQTGSSGIPSTHPNNVDGITFAYTLTTDFLNRYTALRNSCDVFVILSHLGVDGDRRLAPMFPQADVIIGGHSHTKLSPAETQSGVLITQAGSNLNYIGQTTLVLKDKKIIEKKNTLVDVSKLTAVDAGIQNRVETYKANSPMNRVIGQATANISGKDALGCLMTDALTTQLGLDIAFTNSGGIRISSIPKGDITMAKIYELDPFENDVVVYNMSLSEIEALLKYACAYGSINYLVSGAKYTYHTSTKTVTLTGYDDVPLSSAKTYRVGMNSYIAETDIPKLYTPPADPGENLYVSTTATVVDYVIAQQQVSPQPQRAFIE
ncbi:MAG: bifunctional metallophosphatase/5'-nucleotidase [Prevotellaceae bacterium]|jgi:2',3'-cyclic-nucleotide 2'-phosphodiesterase (5'-nucleotidase family)|nr:bifunctional metallophosphatase/5'-nucleotidase [Prevotellaceae bacterium]